MVKQLVDKVPDNELKMRFIQEAAFYEHRLRVGQKAIFHLEAFVAKIMSVYKRYAQPPEQALGICGYLIVNVLS